MEGIGRLLVIASAVFTVGAASAMAQEQSPRTMPCSLRLQEQRHRWRLVYGPGPLELVAPGDTAVARLGAFGDGIDRLHWMGDSARPYALEYKRYATESALEEVFGSVLLVGGVVFALSDEPNRAAGLGVSAAGLGVFLHANYVGRRAVRFLDYAVGLHNRTCTAVR
jgi:hypothetical protein